MTTGRTEFELKFTGSPEDLAALVKSRLMSAIARDGGDWERLSSTYFDTADRVLAAQGLSLRLREESGALIQAVKVQKSFSLSRREYEIPLVDQRAFPGAVGAAAIDNAVAATGPELTEIASSSVDRWSAQVRYKSSRVEIAIDLGRASSRDETGCEFTGPLAELELELISGDPSDLFSFARLINDYARLRYKVVSKLETALSLASPTGQIAKAPRTTVTAQMSGAEVLTGALSDIAARLAEVQPFVLDMRAPEGLRQTRVALRRLRAIERVFRPHLKTKALWGLAQTAKQFGAVFGVARDWDVFIDETLPATAHGARTVRGWPQLKANAERARAEGWANAVEACASKDFTQFLIDLAEQGALGPWRADADKVLLAPVAEFAPRALDRALRKVKKVARTLPPDHALGARHPLRVALKKLRYPVQLFRPLYPKARRADYMAALSGLQDAFGAVNDAVEAQRLVDQAAHAPATRTSVTQALGPDMMHAAGFIAGYEAAVAQSAAKRIDGAWAAFENKTPFWRQ